MMLDFGYLEQSSRREIARGVFLGKDDTMGAAL